MLPTAKNRLAALSPPRLVLGALLTSLALAAVSLVDPRGLRRLQKLEADIARQAQRNRELREENARLSRTVKDLSPPLNAATLERVAREQLGFVRPDDILFKFE
jgi:cell division protein FtsB